MTLITSVICDSHMPKCNANPLSFLFAMNVNGKMKWEFKEMVAVSTTSEPCVDSNFLTS